MSLAAVRIESTPGPLNLTVAGDATSSKEIRLEAHFRDPRTAFLPRSTVARRTRGCPECPLSARLQIHRLRQRPRPQPRVLRQPTRLQRPRRRRLHPDGRWVAIAPPDGSAILALVAPKPGTEKYRLIGRDTQIGFISEDINATYDLWQQPRRPLSSPAPADHLRQSPSPRFQDIDGNAFELIGTDQFTREIEQQRQNAAERVEAERRTAQETRDRQTGPGPALPSNPPPTQNPRLRRRLHPGPSRRRRLLRLPRPRPPAPRPRHRRHRRQRHRRSAC